MAKQKIVQLATLVALGMPLVSHALSQKTAEIFQKSRRELGPPPKGLKATEENSSLRYKTAAQRLDKKTESDSGDDAFASATLTPSDDFDEEDRPAAASSPRPRRMSRSRGLSLARRTEGFDGHRFFGLGFLGAGAYGVFGAEVDFGINRDWTAGFGLGTGMSYNTWGIHGRYFLQKARWSPLVEFGYAQWNLSRVPIDGSGVIPGHLSKIFFENKDGLGGYQPKVAHIIYPGVGVLYQHRSGLAALFELQYFISATNFSGGLFGTMGAYFYF